MLFHIAYWDTFNLNGLSYISVSDILKSAVYPIISTMIFVFIGSFIGSFTGNNPKQNNYESYYDDGNISKLFLFIILVSFVAWIFLIFFILSFKFEYKWFIWAYVASFPLFMVIGEDKILTKVISDRNYRIVIADFIIYLPFLAFASGKYKSEQIQNNSKYTYSTRSHINPVNNLIFMDTIKYLGNTDKNFIFTDLNNKSIFIIKSDNIDTLILKTKE